MKRFLFSLQRELDLRIYREDEAEVELGKAMGILQKIQNRLESLAQERCRAASERFASGNSAMDMLSCERYIKRLDAEKEELLEEAAKAELIVAEKRGAYIEASRQRQALGKVREKRFKEYRKLSLREETKTLDDISAGRTFR